MDRLKMHTPDLTDRNIDRIADLFPSVMTESVDDDGNPVSAIDFDLLRQELSDGLVEGPAERYRLDWPGKRQAAHEANRPIDKTLRPKRDESVDFDTTKNLFIQGDNLDALKLLQESYLGKVKLIYIDPPYNTGNDFVYRDSLAVSQADERLRSEEIDEDGRRLVSNTTANGRFHSDWLSMMFPRLKLARNLLTDDGVVVISIDENEHSNLVALGGEVFGQDAHVGEIVLKNSSKNDQNYISVQHEYIVFFVKNKNANPGDWTEEKGGLDQIYAAFNGFKKKHGDDWAAINTEAKAWYKQFSPSDPVYASKHYTWMDERGVYFPDNISGPNDGQYVYDVPHPVTEETCKMPASGWRYPEASLLQRVSENRVHFGEDHTTVPNNKTYLADTETQSLTSIRYVDGRAASKRLKSLFGEKVFTNPKDELLLCDIYRALGISDADVVLDMFSGSGSALHAVWELNRSEDSSATFIGIQIAEDLDESLKTAKGAAKKVTQNAIDLLDGLGRPRTIDEIGKQRLRLTRESIKAKETRDTGFRVLAVDTTNIADVFDAPDKTSQSSLSVQVRTVKTGRTTEDLLFQVMLDWGLTLDAAITRKDIEDHEIFVVPDVGLSACFETNVSPSLLQAVAATNPMRAVFRDSGFKDDAARINAEQIFAEISPDTELKVI